MVQIVSKRLALLALCFAPVLGAQSLEPNKAVRNAEARAMSVYAFEEQIRNPQEFASFSEMEPRGAAKRPLSTPVTHTPKVARRRTAFTPAEREQNAQENYAAAMNGFLEADAKVREQDRGNLGEFKTAVEQMWESYLRWVDAVKQWRSVRQKAGGLPQPPDDVVLECKTVMEQWRAVLKYRESRETSGKPPRKGQSERSRT